MFGGTAVPFGFQCSSSVSVLKFSGNGRNTWKQLEAIGDIPRGQYGSVTILYYIVVREQSLAAKNNKLGGIVQVMRKFGEKCSLDF